MKIEDCVVEVIHEDEAFSSPKDWIDSGDPNYAEEEQAMVKKILEEREYNPWAWCCVEVVVSWNNISGRATLGCSSYKDEVEFRNSTEFLDVRKEAFEELLESLREMKEKISALDLSNEQVL